MPTTAHASHGVAKTISIFQNLTRTAKRIQRRYSVGEDTFSTAEDKDAIKVDSISSRVRDFNTGSEVLGYNDDKEADISELCIES